MQENNVTPHHDERAGHDEKGSVTANNPDQMNFEQAMAEMEAIVTKLERGEAPLEQSINLYERGMLLKHRLDHILTQAKERIDKITLDNSGEIRSQPMEEF